MRRKVQKKNRLQPDPRYGSFNVSKFTNYLMKDGKKSIALKIIYSTLEEIGRQTKGKDPLNIVEEAIKNASPFLEVRSRRVGGANYQVPREVRPERQLMLAVRWIIEAARARKGQPMFKKLAGEIIAASKKEGAAVKKKEDTHRMAEANRAFAHFAW